MSCKWSYPFDIDSRPTINTVYVRYKYTCLACRIHCDKIAEVITRLHNAQVEI